MLLNQILQKAIVEIALLSLKQFILLRRLEALGAFIEFDVFPDLFKQLQDFVTGLHAHISQENRLDKVIREIERLRLRRQEDESLCILFIALATLQEQNEVLERTLGDGVIILHEEFHGFTKQNGEFLFDADLND